MKDQILNSLALHVQTLHDLTADLSGGQMTQQPTGVPNHPAWTIGHLAHSFDAVGQEVGLPTRLPNTWGDTYGTGSRPETVAQAYPPKQDLLELLDDGHRRIRDRLNTMDDDALCAPLPDEELRTTLPTLGDALLHILIGHTAAHLGQLAVWRKAMGLPATTMII